MIRSTVFFSVHSPTDLFGVFFTPRKVTPNSERIGGVCVRRSAGHKRMKYQMQRHGSSHSTDCAAACCHSPERLPVRQCTSRPNRSSASASRALSLSATCRAKPACEFPSSTMNKRNSTYLAGESHRETHATHSRSIVTFYRGHQ